MHVPKINLQLNVDRQKCLCVKPQISVSGWESDTRMCCVRSCSNWNRNRGWKVNLCSPSSKRSRGVMKKCKLPRNHILKILAQSLTVHIISDTWGSTFSSHFLFSLLCGCALVTHKCKIFLFFVTSGREKSNQVRRPQRSLHQDTTAEKRKMTKMTPNLQHPEQETKMRMEQKRATRMKRKRARWWRPCWRRRTWSSRARRSMTPVATARRCSRPPSCRWTRTQSHRKRTSTGCS